MENGSVFLLALAVIIISWLFSLESFLLRKVVLFHLVKYLLVCFVSRFFVRRILFLRLLLPLAIGFAIYDTLSWSHILDQTPEVKGRFFIAANLFNSENILPYFTRELDLFIRHVGEKNVFVSIVEDHSTDSTPILLQDWASRLRKAGVSNQIITDFSVPEKKKVDRIQRMAFLRNAALQPFFDPRSGFAKNARSGDKVIFINDILFFKEDLLVLADTTKETDSAACSVDFGQHGLYDIWVTRDSQGRDLEQLYPHFISLEDQALWSRKLPVPVFSCWNGVVVMDAHLLTYFTTHLLVNQPFKSIPSFKTTHPSLSSLPLSTPGIRFRDSNMNECYSSECFLVWLDLRRDNKKISLYIHPKVIVTYSLHNYLVWKEFHSWKALKYLSTQILKQWRIVYQVTPHKDQHIYHCISPLKHQEIQS
ncbi:hypothetical protein DSO57_1001407 [Entomophthora muscae]|uniref:Uncharacterized protein n=1 Tax=Entomophthora muscae TaxID=34485 RepID=A0ACC2TJV4_9FUNG|nr:hypothetical protein DSO57_1001407 [Entomophthora muscae]